MNFPAHQKWSSSGNNFLVFPFFNEKEHEVLPLERERQILCNDHAVDGLVFGCFASLPIHLFKMIYFNSDGRRASMCGNGLLCLLAARRDSIKEKKPFTVECDAASYQVQKNSEGDFWIEMNSQFAGTIDLSDIERKEENHFTKAYFINTGVPHAVFLLNGETELMSYPLQTIAPEIRFDPRFSEGTNVDIVKRVSPQKSSFRVYERGVEGETGSSGTGAVACGYALNHWFGDCELELLARGGALKVHLKNGIAYLSGKAHQI